MVFKLLEAASERWRAFNGAQHLTDVINGHTYKNGIKHINDDDNPIAEQEGAA